MARWIKVGLAGVGVAATLLASGVAVRAQDAEPESAVTWLGDPDAAEAFLRTADIVSMEEIGTGVTKPWRARLAPGGPIESLVWKPITPGIQQGFWESYKSEVAAYELDKLLELNMTPPTVERRVRGDLGAAVWWVSPQESWTEMGGQPTPPNLHIGRWNYQLIRAKMFHNLIYNRDPNMGNWLVDPSWNLIIIDNSRAFTPDSGKRVHKLTRIDRDLWDRIDALDEATLTSALGESLSDREIEGILERRDDMREDVEALVAAHGETQVFVRFMPVPSGAPSSAPSSALGGQLVDALNETPVVLPASEISWFGHVVRLADYAGPETHVATAGVAAGHTYGLVTDLDGLICLRADPWDADPHDALLGLVGREAEIFGLAEVVDGMTVARVTLSRER